MVSERHKFPMGGSQAEAARAGVLSSAAKPMHKRCNDRMRLCNGAQKEMALCYIHTAVDGRKTPEDRMSRTDGNYERYHVKS